MPKYRLLTEEELKELQGVFVNFLAAKSIQVDEWEKIKKHDKEKLNALIEEFSDVVFEKTLSNVKLMEKREPHKYLMYSIDDDEIKLLGIEIKGDTKLDFTKGFSIKDIYDLFEKDNETEVSFIIGHKPYFEDKNKEIFDLMQRGIEISQNEELYRIFKELKDNYE